MSQAHDIDDGLTDEERAALADDEGDDSSVAESDDAPEAEEAKETEEAPKDEAKKEDEVDKPADAEGAAAEPEADEQPAAAEAQQQSAPVLVAQAPEDAEARLTEISTKKDDLLERFDNGDITAREYQKELDALNKQERAIERQQDRAELAGQLEAQRQQNDWMATCNAFIAANKIYAEKPDLYKELDSEVRFLGSKPETANWTGQQFLDAAHKRVMLINGIAAAPAPAPASAKPAAKPRADLPPNLAKVPSADIEDTSGGRFAVLNRMSGVELEAELAKMSENDRNAYLASA